LSVIVVNKVTLSVPVEEVARDVERETPPILRSLAGFEGATVVKTGATEMVMIIRWSSADAAVAGAAVVGPGAFNTWVAPRATNQDRAVGAVLFEIDPA
jgi:hypothetical protein